MTIVSPRPNSDFVYKHGRLTVEGFTLLQSIVNTVEGLRDPNNFLYTIIMGVRITVGTASPEGVVTGSRPDIFLRTDGAAGSIIYAKSSGAATNTGWAAV